MSMTTTATAPTCFRASYISPRHTHWNGLQASYVLLRTEDDASEPKIEEAYWVFGAEYADSRMFISKMCANHSEDC